MNVSLHGRLVTDFAELRSVATRWDELAAMHPRPQVFYSFAWHAAAWRAYGSSRELCTVLVEAGDERRLVGVLPVALDRERGRELRFFALPHSDYNDMLVERGVEPVAVLRVALALLGAFTTRGGTFEHVPEGAILLDALAALPEGAPERSRLQTVRADVCPTLLVGDGAVLDELLKKKSLRRHERALEKLGGMRFERLRDRASIRGELAGFFAQHQARRAMAGDRSLFVRDRSRQFYDALIDELDPDTTLHFTLLRAGGGVAAYHLGFATASILTWYKPTIDVDLWDLGPGEVLIKHLIECVRDDGFAEFDFTRGNEAFKERFTNLLRHNSEVRWSPSGVRGWVRGVGAAASRFVRARPRLATLARRTIGFGGHLRAAVGRHGPIGLLGHVVRDHWSRRVARREEIIVYRRARADAAAHSHGQAPDGVTIAYATLGELAASATDCPQLLTGDGLQRARKRLKAGERAAVARIGGKLAHVAWSCTRERLVATEVGVEQAFDLPEPSTVVYECWTAPEHRGRGLYPAVLQFLVATAAHEDVWIFCDVANRASRRGIEKAGFVPYCRVGRTLRFGKTVQVWNQHV